MVGDSCVGLGVSVGSFAVLDGLVVSCSVCGELRMHGLRASRRAPIYFDWTSYADDMAGLHSHIQFACMVISFSCVGGPSSRCAARRDSAAIDGYRALEPD